MPFSSPMSPTTHCSYSLFKSYVLHLLSYYILFVLTISCSIVSFCCSLHAHHFPMPSVPDICCVHFGFVACSYCLTLILSIFVPCTHGPRKFFCCFLMTPLLYSVAVIGGDLWQDTLLRAFSLALQFTVFLVFPCQGFSLSDHHAVRIDIGIRYYPSKSSPTATFGTHSRATNCILSYSYSFISD